MKTLDMFNRSQIFSWLCESYTYLGDCHYEKSLDELVSEGVDEGKLLLESLIDFMKSEKTNNCIGKFAILDSSMVANDQYLYRGLNKLGGKYLIKNYAFDFNDDLLLQVVDDNNVLVWISYVYFRNNDEHYDRNVPISELILKHGK